MLICDKTHFAAQYIIREDYHNGYNNYTPEKGKIYRQC